MEDKDKRIKELEQELKKLRIQQSKPKKQLMYLIASKIALGNKLESAILANLQEVKLKQTPSEENVVNLIAAIIRRIIRVQLIAFVIAIIPLLLLYNQNQILKSQTNLFEKQNSKIDKQNELVSKQNEYFDKQNLRLDQQTYLLESQRRSSLSFEFNSILNNINDQLQNENEISKSLLGRIIAISRSLKPYRYLNNYGKLIEKPLSPERGQLLIAICNSDLKNLQLQEIFENGDFSYSDLGTEDAPGGLKFKDINFSKINLKNSNLRNVQFYRCNFTGSKFSKSELMFTYFHECVLDDSNFTSSNLAATYFSKSSLKNVELAGNKCSQLKFKENYLPEAEFFYEFGNIKSNLVKNSNFENAFVPSKNWIHEFKHKNKRRQLFDGKVVQVIKRLPPLNCELLEQQYIVDETKEYKNMTNLNDTTKYFKIILK